MSSAEHFGHREGDGVVVDLFWHRGLREHEFRVEVVDAREGAHFVLHPTTGREAIEAFYHPFSVASRAQPQAVGVIPQAAKATTEEREANS